MSACRFQHRFPGRPEVLVHRIDRAIKGAGGSHSGGAGGGSFSIPTPVGSFAGRYEIREGIVDIMVTEKPLFIPCSMIRRQLDDYLRGVEPS